MILIPRHKIDGDWCNGGALSYNKVPKKLQMENPKNIRCSICHRVYKIIKINEKRRIVP